MPFYWCFNAYIYPHIVLLSVQFFKYTKHLHIHNIQLLLFFISCLYLLWPLKFRPAFAISFCSCDLHYFLCFLLFLISWFLLDRLFFSLLNLFTSIGLKLIPSIPKSYFILFFFLGGEGEREKAQEKQGRGSERILSRLHT